MVALYLRRSVEKKDSISLEFQEERCKARLKPGEEYEIFKDNGISGKTTENRPEFQRMMAGVRNGAVSRIIIYKFDRISRSLLDFVTMQSEFQQYNVELISCEENFDTSNPIGRVIVNILMMFAEMERETIEKRITDNYYARGEKGMYLGGYAPFGFNKVETVLNNKKTYTFEENQTESPILRKMYADYASGKSLGEITRWLNDNRVPTRKKKPWSPTAVSRMLKNPVYVKANADVYNYLAGLGAKMKNPIEEYNGKNGCYVYGNTEERKGTKFIDLNTDFVSLGLHAGLIEPSDWLDVQKIFQQKKGHSNLGTGSLTWLQGLVKCKCGYTYYVKRCKTTAKEHKYLYCRGRRNNTCTYPPNKLSVETLETIVEGELLSRLAALKGESQILRDTPEINAVKIILSETDKKIQNLIKQLAEGSQVTAGYINQHIEKLDEQKMELLDSIAKLELKAGKESQIGLDIKNILEDWQAYDIETKKKIAKEAIEKIVLEDTIVNIIFY